MFSSKLFSGLFLSLLLTSCSQKGDTQLPLCLHPDNPHYFLFRGEPVILIGSTEHYGAVMNLDFDYVKYLNELKASGLNVTRTFTGIYVEPEGAFGITKNTMAPAYDRFICPWKRSSEPGYANGGNKFDLSGWNEAYFERLKDFVAQAGQRDIIVELDLFSNFYKTIQWKLSPLHISNNINGIGDIMDHKEVLSIKHLDVLGIQEKMVRKIVTELNDFDNLYYEICNEPYFGDTLALRQWEDHMTAVVALAEKDLKKKHLISNNVANKKKSVPKLRDNVSIYNFHYARPPVTVPLNYHLSGVIGDNETGFAGIDDATYRMEAWGFILSGGGLFNHLDYSFAVGHEDGSYKIVKGEPGGGGKTLRNQFKILAEFMQSVDYINMKPADTTVFRLHTGDSTEIYGLSGKMQDYALYLISRTDTAAVSVFDIDMPAGSYTINWVDTKTAEKSSAEINDHAGGWVTITSPSYTQDIALCILQEL